MANSNTANHCPSRNTPKRKALDALFGRLTAKNEEIASLKQRLLSATAYGDFWKAKYEGVMFSDVCAYRVHQMIDDAPSFSALLTSNQMIDDPSYLSANRPTQWSVGDVKEWLHKVMAAEKIDGVQIDEDMLAEENIDGETLRRMNHVEFKYVGFIKMKDRILIMKARNKLFARQ